MTGGRSGTGWDQAYLDEEHHRLRHARAHCDFYLPTDGLTEEEVLKRYLGFLELERGAGSGSSINRRRGDQRFDRYRHRVARSRP